MPAIVFSVYSAFDNCFSDYEDDSKDATDIKLLIRNHHLSYPQLDPSPGFFPQPYPNPTDVKKACGSQAKLFKADGTEAAYFWTMRQS